jgi:hypothetical protein
LAQIALEADLTAGELSAFLPMNQTNLASMYSDGSLPQAAEEEVVAQVSTWLTELAQRLYKKEWVLISQFADGATLPQEGADPPERQTHAYETWWLTGSSQSYHDGEIWVCNGAYKHHDAAILLRDSLWHPALVALGPAKPDTLPVGDGALVPQEALRVWMREVATLLVGAWDAGNYLIWRRGARLP